ncbi:MAG: TrmH family RNA methyltransferase [Gemmatimonadota bacterium]
MPSISRAKRLRSLQRARGRREHGRLIAEGPNVVRDVLASGCAIDEGLYTPAAALDPAVAAVLDDLRAAGVPLEEVSDAEFRGFAGTRSPRGILVVAAIPRRALTDVSGRRLAVLDAVQEPGNVGTLIRAADALGASAVVTLPGTADPWSPKCVRAAAGAGFRLPVVESSVSELAEWCRSHGVRLLAAAASGEPVPRAAGARDAALVFGNEGAGVSDAVLAQCDGSVAIPQRGPADSLNVAMAGAILMDRFFGG